MPYDYEIHLGFAGPEAVEKVSKNLGLDLLDSANRPIVGSLRNHLASDSVDVDDSKWRVTLDRIHVSICLRMEWKKIGTDKRGKDIFETPFGQRKIQPIRIAIQYDPEEIGDEPEDCSLGIALSSRYSPLFIDARSKHGTLGSILDLESAIETARLCKEEIEKEIPEFKDARIFLRGVFY